MAFTNKESLVIALKQQIATRDNQALKALVTVFNNQTEEEQIAENVEVYNNMGFTPFDAEFMTSLAKQYISKKLSFTKAAFLCEESHAKICKTAHRAGNQRP